jgi:hypothetical protein
VMERRAVVVRAAQATTSHQAQPVRHRRLQQWLGNRLVQAGERLRHGVSTRQRR